MLQTSSLLPFEHSVTTLDRSPRGLSTSHHSPDQGKACGGSNSATTPRAGEEQVGSERKKSDGGDGRGVSADSLTGTVESMKTAVGSGGLARGLSRPNAHADINSGQSPPPHPAPPKGSSATSRDHTETNRSPPPAASPSRIPSHSPSAALPPSPVIPPASPLREFIALPATLSRPPLATTPVNTAQAGLGAARSRSFVEAFPAQAQAQARGAVAVSGKMNLWKSDGGTSGSSGIGLKKDDGADDERMDLDVNDEAEAEQANGADLEMEGEEEIDELESDHPDRDPEASHRRLSASTSTTAPPPSTAVVTAAATTTAGIRTGRKRRPSVSARAASSSGRGRAGQKGKGKTLGSSGGGVGGGPSGSGGKRDEGDKENQTRAKSRDMKGRGSAAVAGEGKGDLGDGEEVRMGEYAYEYVPISQRKEGRQNIRYEMIMRQQPVQARMCGVGEKSDRRPIDPAPIIQLIVDDPEAEEAAQGEKGKRKRSSKKSGMSFMHNPYYFLYATLIGHDAAADDPNGNDDADANKGDAQPSETELHFLDDGKTRYLTGTPVSSLYYVRDLDLRDAAFFCFPDLGVRKEGKYRLKLTLFEIVDQEVYYCATTYTDPFVVLSAKKFPGMSKPTELSRTIAEQGLKIRVRKDGKKRSSVPPPRNKRRSSVTEHDELYNSKRTRPSTGSGNSGTTSPYPPNSGYAHYSGHAHSMPPPPIPYSQNSRATVHPSASTEGYYGQHSGRPVTHPPADAHSHRRISVSDYTGQVPAPVNAPAAVPISRARPYMSSAVKLEPGAPAPGHAAVQGRSEGIPFAGYPPTDPAYTRDLHEKQKRLIESQRREIDARAEIKARREREAKIEMQRAAAVPLIPKGNELHERRGYGHHTPTTATAHVASWSHRYDGPIMQVREDRRGPNRAAERRDGYGQYHHPVEIDLRHRADEGYRHFPPQQGYRHGYDIHSSTSSHSHPAYHEHPRADQAAYHHPNIQHHRPDEMYCDHPPPARSHPDTHHPHSRHPTSGSTSMSSRSTPQPLRTPTETPTISHQLLHPHSAGRASALGMHVDDHQYPSAHSKHHARDRDYEHEHEHDWRAASDAKARSHSPVPIPLQSDPIGLGIHFKKDKPTSSSAPDSPATASATASRREGGVTLPPISSLTPALAHTPHLGEKRGKGASPAPATPHPPVSMGPTPGRDRRLGLGHLVD